VVGAAFALALGKPTTIHIDFVLGRVRMLLDFGVTPYLVFDGDNIPSKRGTNSERHKRREESRARGMELHKAGKTSQAFQEFQKAVDVTPSMARQLIDELKKLNVQYVVAPYEADAQLVYLEQKGIIDGILSEDSDLLVFGAKRLLTKLNQYGELVEFERKDFPICKEISFAGWTDTMFRQMAILSGCDYLPNIGKLGLKTAHAYIRKHKEVEKIVKMILFEGKLIVPDKYLEHFRHAELTFLHHRVFCPLQQKMVFLSDLGPGVMESNLPFLGPYVEPDIAIGVACGDIDPFSKQPLHPDSRRSSGRPTIPDSRRQSYASDPGLKPKKSIETFFKPHRQPLAELDPNSLTPSPSQQRLLDRHQNASWEPRLVSSAPALRRTLTTSTRTSNIPASGGTNRSAFLMRASTMSTYKAPKRQRLCSDSTDPSPASEMLQSPFFSSKYEDASPLAQKKTIRRKTRRSGFDVFSDDSIDDMLLLEAEMQQVAGAEMKHTENEVHDAAAAISDETSTTKELETVPQSSPRAASPSTPSSTTLGVKNAIAPMTTGNESSKISQVRELSRDDEPEEFEDLLEFHVRKQNEALLRSFACRVEGKKSPATRQISPDESRRRTFSAQSGEVQLAALSNLPKAASVSTFREKLNLEKTFAYQTPAVQQSALKNLGKGNAGLSKKCNEKKQSPMIAQPDRQDDTSVAGRGHGHRSHAPSYVLAQYPNGPKGSEDEIIPNSEDEISEVGSPIPKPRLNLSGFAFVP
jgi:exonuclease-1